MDELPQQQNTLAEDEAARLRRNLRIISACNRALFQARSEQEALQSICDTLVAAAQVDVAWIGYCGDDAEAGARRVASAANGADPDRVHLSSWPPASQHDPIGIAIRTGEPCWINDSRAAPPLADGPDEASRPDFKSCVALPLVAHWPGGERIDLRGALALYARTPGSFDESLVEAFAELATHLTHAISGLRHQKASEAELRLVVDTIPTTAWTARPDGSSLFVNRRWWEYTGMRVEDSVGAGWRNAFHPDDIAGHVEKWTAAVATGQPFENEARLRRAADGEFRWFLILGAPLHDDSGNVIRWYGIATDIEDRKRAEESLRRSEAYLAEAQRLSHTGSWAFNVASETVVHSSEEHDRLFGFAPGGGIPGWDDWVSRLHPDDRERTMETIGRGIRDRTDFTFDCRIVHPDGSIKHLHTIGHPVVGAAGDLVEFAGSSIDVTEARRAEEALRESTERWRAVFENNPMMYFVADGDGVVVSLNAFGAEQLGYAAAELTGGSIWKAFYPADVPAAQRNTRRCLEELGQVTSWELRMARKDGSLFWVRVTARAMSLSTEDGVVVLIACQDITERKRAEILTEQVFDMAPDGICIVERDYRYRRANPVYIRRWNAPAEQIVGMHVADLLGSEAFEGTLKPYLDRCFAGEEVTFEWFSQRGGLNLAVSYSPLRGGSEDVDAALVIQRDLTEYLRAADGLREAQAELAHVNRVATIGQLTASIAHEVNQPLTATIGSAQSALRWLETRPPNLVEVRQALERIVTSGGRAADVIDRIRAFVRKAPARTDRLDINDAIREVIVLTRREAGKNGVPVQTQLAEHLPLIEGDRVQLQQVMLNLIVNAIESTNDVDDGRRELLITTARAEASGVLVTVRDSGVGLAANDVERVFDAFYTTKSTGMGMGLAICRSIIQAHGGRVWAMPNTPRGSIFQVQLPGGPNGDRPTG